jgi:hypothetical protein
VNTQPFLNARELCDEAGFRPEYRSVPAVKQHRSVSGRLREFELKSHAVTAPCVGQGWLLGRLEPTWFQVSIDFDRTNDDTIEKIVAFHL